MEQYFTKGSRIPLQNGQSAEVIAKLGEGGQGTVYRVRVAEQEYALKWYHKSALQNPRRFYQNLENNIRQGAPSPAFLWPEFLTKEKDGSFGYVMKLRPSNYREFSDFLLAKVHFSSLSAAANAALNITNGFRELHRKGFSYQDLNDGKCVAISKDGEFTQPIPWDEQCFLNVTTSLCDENAAKEFRFCFSRTLPAAVFIGSDGIDDCFAGDERLYDFYRLTLRSFAQTNDQTAVSQLKDYLPTLSEKGSGDDMSVGIIVNTDFARQKTAAFEKSRQASQNEVTP